MTIATIKESIRGWCSSSMFKSMIFLNRKRAIDVGSRSRVLSTVDDLATLTTHKLMLAGNPVFISLNPIVPPGFIQLQSRDAAGGLLAQFSKNTPKVLVYVDERLIDLPRMRFTFAIDGYLAWGLRERRKVPTILFGGGETDTNTNVDIMVFAENRLIELHEKSLPRIRSINFRDALKTMIAELKITYPTARFVQAAPLTNWEIDEVEYIDDKPLRSLSYRQLTRKFTHRSTYVVPVVLATISFVIYPMSVMMGWNSYSNTVADYEHEIADPAIKSKGGMDTELLNVMNARRMFMEQPRRQTALADKSFSIIQGIATIPNVRVVEIKLPAPNSNPQPRTGISVNPDAEINHHQSQVALNRDADVWLSIAVPKSKNEAAIVQAQAVMIQIANSTGMTLELAHQGWREDPNHRIFNMEGYIHD